MVKTKDKAEEFEAYKESDDFVPNPTDQYGVVRTDGVTGHHNEVIDAITNIFRHARHRDAIIAARALDPEDTAVDPSLVVLPQGAHVVASDPEAAKERVLLAAVSAIEDPIYEPRSGASIEAAKSYDPADIEANREEQNAQIKAKAEEQAAKSAASPSVTQTT